MTFTVSSKNKTIKDKYAKVREDEYRSKITIIIIYNIHILKKIEIEKTKNHT